jgi:prepilin-type processing-associated H-X9-DG protein
MFHNLSSPSSGEWNHLNAGSNILFLDGHVEFQRSSDGDFPINGAMGKFIGLLRRNDSLAELDMLTVF